MSVFRVTSRSFLLSSKVKYFGIRLPSFGVSKSCAGFELISFAFEERYLKNIRMVEIFRARVAGELFKSLAIYDIYA